MKTVLPLTAFALLLAGAAYADCTPPAEVKVPDASTASLDEMKAAGKAIKAADADVKVYGSCLATMRDADYDKIGKDITEEQRETIFKRYQALENEAVDKIIKAADEYNAAVRTWKAAHAPPPAANADASAPAAPAAPAK